jgi:hypothetical protein
LSGDVCLEDDLKVTHHLLPLSGELEALVISRGNF